MKRRNLLFLVSILFLFSCDFVSVKSNSEDLVIARVVDKKLYKSDLDKYMPKDLAGRDSLIFSSSYINSWAKQQLLVEKAALNLSEKSLEFEDLVSEYRDRLYINAYKEALVRQYLDTVVSPQEISDYYSNNRDNFRVNEDLIQLKYAEIGVTAQNPKELISYFRSSEVERDEKDELLPLSFKVLELNDSIWVRYIDFVNTSPIFKNIPKQDFLKKSQFIQKEDSLGLYLARVKDVKYRGETAPLIYIGPTIKRIIIQQRKLDLFRNLEQTLIEDAIKNKEFEIY
jgi:hypothetical protein